MARYKRRIDYVDAVQFSGENVAELIAFAGGGIDHSSVSNIYVNTPSGKVLLEPCDWVAQNPLDPSDFYPIKDAKFRELYEA